MRTWLAAIRRAWRRFRGLCIICRQPAVTADVLENTAIYGIYEVIAVMDGTCRACAKRRMHGNNGGTAAPKEADTNHG